MQESQTVELAREVDAVQIPSGHPVKLHQGMPVFITQSLGGSYTVHADGGLYRISGKDADALGLQATTPATEGDAAASGEALDEQQIWDVLRTCYDPEIPVNIVDLGLVYDMHLEVLGGGKHKVCVKMTLTAPGCGMGGVIAADAQQRLLELPAIEEAQVEIVWDPPWHQSMITAQGRRILGLE